MIDDITKLVKLIDETKDESVKPILRRLLMTWVEKEGALPIMAKEYRPTCKKCGLDLKGDLYTTCTLIDCPAEVQIGIKQSER